MDISRKAFSGCSNITKVTVKNSETSLDSTGLAELENLSIYGHINSVAQLFADKNDIPFYDLKTGERIINEWVVDNEGGILIYSSEPHPEKQPGILSILLDNLTLLSDSQSIKASSSTL